MAFFRMNRIVFFLGDESPVTFKLVSRIKDFLKNTLIFMGIYFSLSHALFPGTCMTFPPSSYSLSLVFLWRSLLSFSLIVKFLHSSSIYRHSDQHSSNQSNEPNHYNRCWMYVLSSIMSLFSYERLLKSFSFHSFSCCWDVRKFSRLIHINPNFSRHRKKSIKIKCPKRIHYWLPQS